MVLDLKLVLIAGILWGVVGVVLILAAGFLAPFIPFTVDGLTLGTYAVLFAGVHFVYRNPSGLVSDLIGGAVAGIIAALILFVASNFLPTGGAMNVGDIVGAVAAGLGGALGMAIIERTKRIG